VDLVKASVKISSLAQRFCCKSGSFKAHDGKTYANQMIFSSAACAGYVEQNPQFIRRTGSPRWEKRRGREAVCSAVRRVRGGRARMAQLFDRTTGCATLFGAIANGGVVKLGFAGDQKG
jgi:hypothetical protein